MKAKLVKEHLNENVESNKKFGFTSKLLGLDANDGKHSLLLTPEFIEKICKPSDDSKTRYLKEPFHARYGLRKDYYDENNNIKGPYRCDFFFRPVTYGDGKVMYFTIGNSGSHGFNGGQFTQRERLANIYVKQCLEQLYKHLETLK